MRNYQRSIGFTLDMERPLSSDWDVLLKKHVFPFCARVLRGDQDWLSIDTLRYASLSMKTVQYLTNEHLSSYAHVRLTRYYILKAHTFTWIWLESICAYYSQPNIAQDVLSTSWPCKLARYLYRVFTELHLTTIQLRPSEFIPHLSSNIDSFSVIGNNEWSLLESAPILQQRVYLQMKRILQRWLHFPQDGFADGQAWVLQYLVTAFGSGVLLLDETWQIYVHFSKYVLGRRKNRVRALYMDQLIPFLYGLRSCDAADTNSMARRYLDTYLCTHQTASPVESQQFNVPLDASISVPMDKFHEELQRGHDEEPSAIENVSYCPLLCLRVFLIFYQDTSHYDYVEQDVFCLDKVCRFVLIRL